MPTSQTDQCTTGESSLAGEGDPTGALAEAINRDFGSLARWKAEFSVTGKALGGGSGWVLLSYSPREMRWWQR